MLRILILNVPPPLALQFSHPQLINEVPASLQTLAGEQSGTWVWPNKTQELASGLLMKCSQGRNTEGSGEAGHGRGSRYTKVKPPEELLSRQPSRVLLQEHSTKEEHKSLCQCEAELGSYNSRVVEFIRHWQDRPKFRGRAHRNGIKNVR